MFLVDKILHFNQIAENERPKLLTQARTEYQKALKQAQIIDERADADSNIIRNQ